MPRLLLARATETCHPLHHTHRHLLFSAHSPPIVPRRLPHSMPSFLHSDLSTSVGLWDSSWSSCPRIFNKYPDPVAFSMMATG
ncbi:hypothetical protein PHYBLDRAFT_140479 [Phycomyces blakesleeanus NRRL 1555(-)]|uniref:Uncharacterized protein n=1 Tax=Phycomyces blakesleeanus (strain ATCC 8743b / DSM 1359 / FGSC 10004 / NBRC 33097 / NRRL 1555) TaxID=763407 RepID=A0A167PR82_PHYB8|nr:hypothetical protein PHYBLDRAFT_140479 [Phycomyces blakesleeanus NRRL 1555(-)]OAD78384.1 hypothetical protein PHYBLDRAFT_140479 [Phycomyces blakesleeanus NRRL 1555(-)]|eukprot:XP_018296424.1 hypothetical protein PHYBLDRAFT_140479 [Phycomyces blakesleeanus NRRL 1555(-)]